MGHSAQIKLRVESDAAVREAFASTAQGSEARARKRQVLGIERKLSGAPHRKDALAQGLKASSQSAHLERLKSSPMSLGVPGRGVAIEGFMATVDFWGVRRQIRLGIVAEPGGPGRAPLT